MKAIAAVTALTLVLVPAAAQAGERGTDAALGAVSGAIVFGPIGAVAGALVGYTAGPAISNSWGTNRSSYRRARAQAREGGYRSAYNETPLPAGPRAAAPRAPAASKYSGPPAQGLE